MLLGADTQVMFITDCQACGLRELRGPRSIELLVNPAPDVAQSGTRSAGIGLIYRCNRCATVNSLHAPIAGTGSPGTRTDRDLVAAYRRQPTEPALVRSAARLAARTAPEW